MIGRIFVKVTKVFGLIQHCNVWVIAPTLFELARVLVLLDHIAHFIRKPESQLLLVCATSKARATSKATVGDVSCRYFVT